MSASRLLPVLLLLCLADGAYAQKSCEPAGGLQFICGPRNAEDLVLVPGTPWILSSGQAEGARLFAIDSRNGAWHPLKFEAKPDAIFTQCTSPPDIAHFESHGLSIRDAGRGLSRLHVVGHGAREAIEVFDVAVGTTGPALTWKGCVPMPDGLAANSVASLADGSLLVTVLLMPGKTFLDSVEKRPTGAVFEWSPGSKGFVQVAGTELPGNNGIEVAADGREFYVVSSGLQTVVAFSHSNPARRLRSTQPLPFTPDNVHRGPDGRLFTGGMANDVPECGGTPGPRHDLAKLASCPRGSMGAALDARTLQHQIIVETPVLPAFSNATMVLPVGQRVWLGTFSGDRIAHGALAR